MVAIELVYHVLTQSEHQHTTAPHSLARRARKGSTAMARTIRQSRQRDLIYDYLRHTHSHPTAETIYNDLRTKSERLSIATVYRNLRLLEELGKVRSVATVNSAERFEATSSTEHAHFICTGCGRVIDVPDLTPKLAQLKETANHEVGTICRADLTLHGLCSECLSKEG